MAFLITPSYLVMRAKVVVIVVDVDDDNVNDDEDDYNDVVYIPSLFMLSMLQMMSWVTTILLCLLLH